MEELTVEREITVIGGGLAGVCAAIAAARQGVRVALVQNRSMLGGNSSSEIRVWVVGATAHGVQHFARETGIMGELFLENQFRNPHGNPYYWDLVVLDAVKSEPNIDLYLNTDVREVDAHGPEADRQIRAVTGWQMGSEKKIRFESPVFIDCSGDGLVGDLAGAKYMQGREPRSMFGEDWAPLVPDNNTLGSTLLFYSKDAGHPSKFVPPTWARDITKTAIPERRVIREDMRGCAYWWIEWGGELDVVHDNELIRDELQAVVYGIWDYIKNSGKFDSDNLTLEWAGSLPGKREYRRFVGDHVLTQQDIVEQREFPDRVAFGGWSIDLHPAGGVYSNEEGALHLHPDGNYHLPLRSLYSINVGNMWMAGRNISASHVAFGGTRVMATCAVLGEAAGTAAAVALQRELTPRQVATEQFEAVKHALIRSDASILGVVNDDPSDLALRAQASASSVFTRPAIEQSQGTVPLDSDLGMVLPVQTGLGKLGILVDAASDARLTAQLHSVSAPQNYLPANMLAERVVDVTAGREQWVEFDFEWTTEAECNVFVVLQKAPNVELHTSEDTIPGTLFFQHRLPVGNEANTLYFREWKQFLKRKSVCLRYSGAEGAYSPSKVLGGYGRPYGGPQMWVSEPMSTDTEPWIDIAWDSPVAIEDLVLIFDDEVDEDLINLHHHFTEHEVMPGLVRDYEVHVDTGSGYQSLIEVRENRSRCRRHRLGLGEVRAVRLRIMATNGAPRAHVVAMRAY